MITDQQGWVQKHFQGQGHLFSTLTLDKAKARPVVLESKAKTTN